jgi:hypothetical protein
MRSTKVSVTSPAIRKILSATALSALANRGRPGPYRGVVVVRELPSNERYVGGSVSRGETESWLIDLSELFGSGRVRVSELSEPGRGVVTLLGDWTSGLADEIRHLAPQQHEALVRRGMVLSERYGKGGIEIIIREDAIDSVAIAVATDALLARDKKAAQEAVGACGATSELCMALAEANAKALKTGEQRVGERPKKTAAVLDREIAAALSRR